MAPRRRAVERATLRRTAFDRLVVVVLVVVAASGLMSILPSSSQRAVSRLGCHAASLGLGRCGAPGLDLQDTQLTPPRCAALGTLDEALPEVRVRQLTAAQGLPVRISTERSGDVYVQLGGAPEPAPPVLVDGAVRPARTVLDGVEVPAQTEWFLPRGQGLEQLVVAVQDQHHVHIQQRSALALVATVLGRQSREVPAPTVRYSQLPLSGSPWPRLQDSAVPPRTTVPGDAPSTDFPLSPGNSVSVQTNTPATLALNRTRHELAVTAPLRGRLSGRPVTGAVRWTRNDQGAVTSLLVAVVTAGPLAPGEPLSRPGAGVAYVSIPVQTGPEQALVQSWFARPGPLTIPLDELLGLRVAPATDQLGSFLTRAATTTILRYGLADPAQLEQRVDGELRGLRREEWDGVSMVEAATITPQPNGVGRHVVSDPGCRT